MKASGENGTTDGETEARINGTMGTRVEGDIEMKTDAVTATAATTDGGMTGARAGVAIVAETAMMTMTTKVASRIPTETAVETDAVIGSEETAGGDTTRRKKRPRGTAEVAGSRTGSTTRNKNERRGTVTATATGTGTGTGTVAAAMMRTQSWTGPETTSTTDTSPRAADGAETAAETGRGTANGVAVGKGAASGRTVRGTSRRDVGIAGVRREAAMTQGRRTFGAVPLRGQRARGSILGGVGIGTNLVDICVGLEIPMDCSHSYWGVRSSAW
jgi:hypothetical protein